MEFCSPFDEELARSGPAAIYVRNTSGQWRLGPDLTRDGRGRHPDPPALDPAFALFRDRGTGLVTWFYVTARALLVADEGLLAPGMGIMLGLVERSHDRATS